MTVFLTLMFLGVGLLLVVRWITAFQEYVRTTEEQGEALQEDEPAGFYKGNWFLWHAFKMVFLPWLWLHRHHYHLIGQENLAVALRLQREGYRIVPLLNHVSSADVWMPQLILWLNGFRTIAEKWFIYVIGLKFFNRHPFFSIAIRCKDRIPIVPPTMIPRERPANGDKEGRRLFLDQLRFARRVNDAAKVALAEKMDEHRWPFLAPEGTRQRNGKMGEPDEGFLTILDLKGRKMAFLPMGLSGSRDMWAPEAPIGTIDWGAEVSLHIETPILAENLLAEAAEKAAAFGISPNRAGVNILMYAVAAGLQKNDHVNLCGIYNTPWEKRDWSKKPGSEGETREEKEVVLAGGS